jgi:hypothetical protein
MRFEFDASNPIIQALLRYAGLDKDLLETAMDEAYHKRTGDEPVTIKAIKDEIDKLRSPLQKVS